MFIVKLVVLFHHNFYFLLMQLLNNFIAQTFLLETNNSNHL
jgi:hypothetical protein